MGPNDLKVHLTTIYIFVTENDLNMLDVLPSF